MIYYHNNTLNKLYRYFTHSGSSSFIAAQCSLMVLGLLYYSGKDHRVCARQHTLTCIYTICDKMYTRMNAAHCTMYITTANIDQYRERDAACTRHGKIIISKR